MNPIIENIAAKKMAWSSMSTILNTPYYMMVHQICLFLIAFPDQNCAGLLLLLAKYPIP